MLPRINVVVPTDAFYALSTEEARDLNENGGDIITGEDFPRGREAGEEGEVLRSGELGPEDVVLRADAHQRLRHP